MQRTHRFVVSCFHLLAIALLHSSAPAATNAWINPASGKWEETTGWSLGHAPTSSESAAITNANEKTITIDAVTSTLLPGSLNPLSLNVAGANTLFINNPSPLTPLLISERLDLGPGGRILQSGGTVQAASVVLLDQAIYAITNALFATESMEMVYPAEFVQHGGFAEIDSLKLYVGRYQLNAGLLNSTELRLHSQFGIATFLQTGGTNQTSSLSLSSPVIGSTASYELNGGSLFSGTVLVGPDSTISQSGGIHFITNQLTLQGAARNFPPQVIPSTYSNEGTLKVLTLEMNEFASFTNRGHTEVSDTILFKGGSTAIGRIDLSAGVLTCGNVAALGAPVDINQTGGDLVVQSQLWIGGHYSGGINGTGARFARYTLAGGTLQAPSILLHGDIIISDSIVSPAITNDSFSIAGSLTIGNANEQLGHLLLISNSVIDLPSSTAKVTFRDSSQQFWSSAAVLQVKNWNGNLDGAGQEQLRFGTNQNGLNGYQLSKIQFVNPAGLSTGVYPATILETGEIVPDEHPPLNLSNPGNNFVLSWNAGWVLQVATNAAGPYLDLPSATSPYTNASTDPQKYFRIRLP